MKKLLLIICALLISAGSYAQSFQVSGVVTDEKGTPLPGVSVVVKDTLIGQSGGANGDYVINVPKEGSILVFSFIGYETREIKVSAATTTLNVKLKEDALAVDPVVAIGYGTARRSDITGAVSSVSSDDLQKSPLPTVDQALQGRVAGVTVNAQSGQPGASAQVRIRGIGAAISDSSPIYVVDGVITSDINFLNPNDVQSIEVLKDASSTAIYGSRGANGVIIVTTKSGEKDQPMKVAFDAYVGVQNRWKKLDLMKRDEFVQTLVNIRNVPSERNFLQQNGVGKWIKTYMIPTTEPYFGQNLDYGKIETDWQDEVFKKNAVIQNYNVTVTGGSSKAQYSLSGGYFSQDGTIIGSNYRRLTLRSNTSYQIRKWLRLGENISFSSSKARNAMNNSSSAGASILSAALAMAPWDPTHYPEGTLNCDGEDLSGQIAAGSNFKNVTNPFSMVDHSHPDNRTERWLGNVFLEITPIEGLVFRSSVSMDLVNTRNREFKDAYAHSSYDQSLNNFVSSSISRGCTMFYDNTLTYSRTIGRHNFSAMVGQTTEEYNYFAVSGSGSKITNPTPNNWYVSNATDKGDPSDDASRTRRFSMLGRLFYGYDERYLITLNFRADGSSKFPNNLWGYFPSTAVAWRISQEKFLRDSPILDNLKLRLGWGRIGNDKISESSFTQTVGSSDNWFYGYPLGNPEALVTGAAVNTLVNTGGKWETTEQWNLGVDFALWKSKLYGTVDFFQRDTKDMLLYVNSPVYVGNLFSPMANVGTVRNKGVEIQLGHINRINEVSYDISANVSLINNELTRLNGGSRLWSGYTMCDEGLPLFSFWGYEYEGIYQSDEEVKAHQFGLTSWTEHAGDARYKDQDGNGVIDDNDMVNLGNAFPWLTYGLNLSVNWRGFDASMFWQGVYGNKLYNAMRLRTEGNGEEATLSTTMRNVWTASNPTGTIPNQGASGSSRNNESSSRFVESGAYLRLKNLQIGYSLPEKIVEKAGMSRVRFYLTGSNLLTFTKYSGYDPEVGGGIDYGNYPSSITVTLGVNIDF